MANPYPKVQCQCGAISFHTSRPKPLAVYICHCTECRKQSSSAFGTSAIFPAKGMWPLPEDVQSKLGKWTRTSDKGTTLECYFCKECGVRVLHRPLLPNGTPKPTLTIKGGALEGFSVEGARHIWTKSAVVPVPEGSWLESPEGSDVEMVEE
ncbi:glutathione-dependent formaldehyde-activating enzyme protein [Pochonia chlamydosporia 170]|uniref:Glutathione-dependent formaldehyde-activating enzyme protein n=1 Tax=Pochonia chlamydosporia 170 TaxID=1380566 RepID=A0A179FR88_METCM|nr:glutathione-dependent formaldehyde-activating enzyme protein [Pochonia chlamydosporia 170]OAQ67720.1 glutathione-dependent formaldehyde-activating enzyme protein [Pochonia chlamydosporia 170]